MGDSGSGDNNQSGDHNSGDQDDQWTCCNDSQSLFILLYIAFCALALITWKSMIAKPMRLMSVFLHEMSHAVACWVSGGDVYNIEVYQNEGGVTRYAGGCRCLIIPAGYCGVSVWSMVFVVLSGGRRTATAGALVLTASLLLALCYSPNRLLVYISLAYAFLTSLLIYLEWFVAAVSTPLLQLWVLGVGVCVGLFALADIKDDTIVRTVEASDAYACSKEVWPCCNPKCIGLQWALFAMLCQFTGIWIALEQMSDECEYRSWWNCLTLGQGLEGVFDDWGEDRWDFEGFWEQRGANWGGGDDGHR